MIAKETLEQIALLADEMTAQFTPPELIAGCEVLSVADRDQYATNNGWIEARVGQHNQQRCRWRGQYSNPEVGDFIDVLYFASYRLFVVFGQGGAAAPKTAGGSGNIWPAPGKLMIGATEYATLAAAVAAAVSGDTIYAGVGTHTADNVTLPDGVNLFGADTFHTVITSSAATRTLTIGANCEVGNFTVTNTYSSASRCAAVYIASNSAKLIRITASATNPGAGRGFGFEIAGGTNTELHFCAGSGSKTQDFYAYGASTTLRMYGGDFGSGSASVYDADTALSAGNLTFVLAPKFNSLNWDNNPNGLIFTSGGGRRFLGNAGLTMSGNAVTGISIDGTLAANSDANLSTQKAVKTYVDARIGVFLVTASAAVKQATFAAALAAAASGNEIRFVGPFSEDGAFTASVPLSVIGDSTYLNLITRTAGTTGTVLTISGASTVLANLKISSTGAGGGGVSHTVLANSQAGLILRNIVIEKITGSSTTALGFVSTGGDALLRHCKINVSAGSITNYAVYLHTAGSTVVLEGGEITAGAIVTAHASAVVELRGVKLGSGVTIDTSGGGTVRGWYVDENGVPRDWNGNLWLPVARVPEPIFINGSLQLWQRGTSFAAAADGTYSADRMGYYKSGSMVHTLSQSTDVPTVAQAGILVPYSLLAACTTADTSITSGKYTLLMHTLEGFNFLAIAQRAFILTFWVKATKTGTYCVSFRNSGNDRSYVAEYTISAADTWEFKSIVVPASPTAGTWDYTTGAGLRIAWALACGSTFQNAAGSWATGNYLGSSNQVNACDSTSNNFRLALVSVQPGNVVIPAMIPDRAMEVARCERYYQVYKASDTTTSFLVAQAISTSAAFAGFPFRTLMRVAPTLAVSAASHFGCVTATASAVNACSTVQAAGLSQTNARIEFSGSSGLAAGNATWIQAKDAAAELRFSAEFT